MITATVPTAALHERPRCTRRRVLGSAVLTSLLLVGGLATVMSPAAAANEVLTWNETMLKVVAVGGQNPFHSSRTLAMVHGAVHDALNAITRRYAAYFFEEPGAPGASPEAAVAAATHTVLVGVVPSFGTPAQKVAAHALAEEAYLAALRHGPAGPAQTQGVAVGRAAAVVLAGVLGTDQVAFAVTSNPPFPEITRSFTSFSQAAREAADSRIYAGIHFRMSCEDGLVLGRKVGQRVLALYLQPARK